ncbi:Rtr1/RPAP2 family-domain-containing protein [Podospora didyma]|uniref:RNA polymerase II subunit B1 CTD phosphatase RPAP2 homolog n=1 Tax=Podospora didyma TaxID=330526 RepID=A0AAE0U485_9PEZI|nr:Rtr1/RPAP2 family-domain-containing protein [Podospora didyma]
MSGPSSPPDSRAPKGILKAPKSSLASFFNATTTPPEPSSSGGASPSHTALPREHQLAIAQAKRLAQLRDEEIKPAIPLEIFERLSTFPLTSSPASAPSPADAAEFISSVCDFTPMEYLDLIEERNCLGKCGYALCARSRRNYEGEFKLQVSTGTIARTEDLNKWCSDECALRALFIKVQLDNPSYLRKDGKMVVKVELREEKNKKSAEATGKSSVATPSKDKRSTTASSAAEEDTELTQAMDMLELTKENRDAAALSVERGDGGRTSRPGHLFNLTIREKSSVAPARAPDPEDHNAHHMVEGHRITFGTDKDNRNKNGDSDDDDLFPTIHV